MGVGRALVLLALVLAVGPWGQPEPTVASGGQGGCEGCARAAIVERATSNIPFYVSNTEILRRSTASSLVENLTTPCFHLLRPEVVEAAGYPVPQRIPEYVFLVDFSHVQAAAGEAAKPNASRLTIDLLYNGDPREYVFRLSTDSSLDDLSTQGRQMYTNPNAAIKQVKPIDEVLQEFERRPRSGTIDLGKTKELAPGEEVELKLTNLQDEKGRASKHFNRVVIEAERGRIKSGARLVASPERRAFRVGNGTVTFTYQAPDACSASQDRIIVHASCSILDPAKDPMEMTSVERRIVEKTVPLACPDLVAEYVTTFERDIHEPERNGRGREVYRSTIRATYKLRRASSARGEIEEGYRLLSSALTQVSGEGKYNAHYVDGTGDEHTINMQFVVSGGRIDTGGTGISVTYDAATESVRSVTPDIFGVAFELKGESRETIKRKNGRVSTSTTPVGLVPVLLPVVSTTPEFERASGSRDGGVISGGGTHAFSATPTASQRLTLAYTLKKTK